MKKICVLGTHGSAKTSLVYKLAAFYKMREVNTIVVHETARKSPFPINKAAGPKTTMHLMSLQLLKELEAEAQGFEMTIVDRSLGDAPVYINFLNRGNVFTEKLDEFATLWAQTYDVMVYLEPDENRSVGGDGVRAEDKEYQIAIRDNFRSYLDSLRKYYGSTINIVEAESSAIFDTDVCVALMENIAELAESKQELVHV